MSEFEIYQFVSKEVDVYLHDFNRVLYSAENIQECVDTQMQHIQNYFVTSGKMDYICGMNDTKPRDEIELTIISSIKFCVLCDVKQKGYL